MSCWYNGCSCIHWGLPFCPTAIRGHKWRSLFLIFNIPKCWNHEWCSSKSICWSHKFCRFLSLTYINCKFRWLFIFYCFHHNVPFSELLGLIGALCASYLIDKQGRKKLLIGSYLGMVNIFFVYHINSFAFHCFSLFWLNWFGVTGSLYVSYCLFCWFPLGWRSEPEFVNTWNTHVSSLKSSNY